MGSSSDNVAIFGATSLLTLIPPPSTTHASVVSQESVPIAFLIAGLNDFDIEAADIGNAYLNAPPREKVWSRI